MKHIPTSLLTAALSLAAASAYMQAAKSSPAVGASAYTVNATHHRVSHRSRDHHRRERTYRSRRGDAREQVRFFSGEAEYFRQRLQRCAHLRPATKTRCRLELLDLVTDHRRESTDTVNDGKGPDNMTAKADIIKYLKDSFAFGHKAITTLNRVEPCPTDYLEQWQADHSPIPGNIRRCSRVRSLRSTDRISPYEWYHPARESRAIVQAGINSQ